MEERLRTLAPQVLGALVRRYGQFDACDDAVQEALLAAGVQWPADGIPENPRGWLITVASRRLTDEIRSEHARRRREDAVAAAHEIVAPAPAPRAEDTDCPQILTLYEVLERLEANPVVTLNKAVAVAMVHGPQAGLDRVERLEGDDRMAEHHRLHAVRAHLLEMAGDTAAARDGYRAAARLTTSLPERRYLEGRAARLS